ncbi:MAG: N-acetylmuramoyl-L-alanine amidase [Caldisericia bacterium]|nr:N-acetylmuramoyl-L-alanine amidase [Caldisericia bacterium]
MKGKLNMVIKKLLLFIIIFSLILPISFVISQIKEVIITPPTNIRTGPGLNYDILTTITERMVLKVLSEAKDGDGRVWYKVKIEKLGKEGFVASWVVEVQKKEETKKENSGVIKEYTNLRTGPSISYEVIRSLEPDTKILISGMALNSSNEVWYFAKIDNSAGWVFSERVNLIYIEKVVDTKLINTKYKLLTDKFLYEGPSEEMKTGEIISSGKETQIVGISLIFPDIYFYEIVFNGKLFWIKSSEEVPKQTQGEVQINDINFVEQNGNIIINILGNGEIKNYSDSVLSNPIRIVVDIQNTIILSGSITKEIQKYGILRVRASQFSSNPKITRIVVDLSRDIKYNIKKITNGIQIAILSQGNASLYNVYLSDDYVYLFPSPVEKSGTLFIPLKSFLSSIGISSEYDDNSKTFSFFYKGLKVDILDFKKVQRGNKTREFSITAAIIGDTFFVPIDFLPFMIDTGVFYDKDNKNLYLDPYIYGIDINKESLDKVIYTINLSFISKYTYSISGNNLTLSINALPYPEVDFKTYDFVSNIETKERSTSISPITKIVLKLESGYKNIQITSTKAPPSIKISLSRDVSKGLSGKLVILDPGHGAYTGGVYYDVGAVGPSGAYESKIVLDIALRIKELLEKSGAIVLMTRTEENNKSTPNLDQRVQIANSSGGDLFLSIHLNASTSSSTSGTETYYFHPFSLKFAELVHKKIINALNTIDRGVRNKGFAVVKDINTMPSVLIEPVYISNPNEEKIILNENMRQKLAEAIFEAISEYFNQ